MHDIRPFLPGLFNDPGTLLYIGCRPDAHSWLDELIEAGNEVDILEVWKENIDGLFPLYGSKCMIIGLDVRNVDTLLVAKYDYIFYWHGPEHLRLSEVEEVLEKLERKTKRILALACPWGKYPQGAHAGNPYEEHKCTLYPHVFEMLGYEVETDGYRDEPGSQIVAWKCKQK